MCEPHLTRMIAVIAVFSCCLGASERPKCQALLFCWALIKKGKISPLHDEQTGQLNKTRLEGS